VYVYGGRLLHDETSPILGRFETIAHVDVKVLMHGEVWEGRSLHSYFFNTTLDIMSQIL
jgi:hypothetical protein